MLEPRLEATLRAIAIAALTLSAGCAYQPPTIAHIHIGHTVTGVEGTPEDAGYMTIAEQSAEQALTQANDALAAGSSVADIKDRISQVNEITNVDEARALTHALQHSMEHLRFAAESEDASENVRSSLPSLESYTEGIYYRSNLIKLYSQDLTATASQEDARVVAEQVQQLAYANVNGEDLDDDGRIGIEPKEMGMVQLRAEINAMIAREDPPYVTVDRWYLFNLVRLPDGNWIFRRQGSGASRGY